MAAAAAARCAKFLRHRIALRRIELGERFSRKAREMIERLRYQRGVAAERRQHVGLDRGVVRAGHLVFVAGGDDHRSDGAEIVALG